MCAKRKHAHHKSTDNAPTLFLLAHNRHRILPEWLRINTLRIPDNYASGEATEDAGKIFAVLSSPGGGGREIPTLELCIKGPPADSTEQALRALLDKMERMMGRMWEMATAQGKVVKGKWFLRSIDEQS